VRCLRLIGSLKLYDSFAEYRLFCRALLQKRPIILRSLLIVATEYHIGISHISRAPLIKYTPGVAWIVAGEEA